jgi:hypothetical protein
MSHGGELLLTLVPWVTTFLVCVAVYDDLDFPGACRGSAA